MSTQGFIERRGGVREGAGRPKKLHTQVKDFVKEYPQAVEELMVTLYELGIKGDIEAAKYVIDRIKGKPKATLGIAEEDKELLKASTVVEFYKLMDRHALGSTREPLQIESNSMGGTDAVQGQREAEELQQGQDEEGSG